MSARILKNEVRHLRLVEPDESARALPQTRAECERAHRPCPYVTCRYHLYLDVQPNTGALKMNFPDLEPDELQESCALDVADRGPMKLETVGAMMNLTRERARQVENKALARLARLPKFDR